MMRSVLFALLLSGSALVLSANAFAQTSPDTRQTDQSEEDWRKSKKKTGSTDDILDIIKNTRGSGVGNGRGYSPIDALPEESRRYLMKERAKRIARAGPGEPVDVSYTPSPAAKSDPNLEADEQAAWSEMAQGMNGDSDIAGSSDGSDPSQSGSAQGGSSQAGTSPNGNPQVGIGASSGSQGQNSGQSSDGSQDSTRSSSVMRGGSSASVADIMAQIKGIGSASGTDSEGTASGRSGGESQQGQQGQQGQQNSQAAAQNQSEQNQSALEASQKASDAAHNVAHSPEPIGPLDRLKKSNQEQSGSGRQSSASDFLKKKD